MPIKETTTSANEEGTSEKARRALVSLKSLPEGIHSLRIDVGAGESQTTIDLPTSTLSLVVEVLMVLADGTEPLVMPHDKELSTQEAANLLNVSRPYLVSLLEDGEISFRMVGTHRRVRATDVLAYKREQRSRSKELMEELAHEAQEY